MDPRFITAIVIAVVVIWGVYRRARRFIGRQTLQPGRLWARIAILAAVSALVLVPSARNLSMVAAMLGGACCGVVLGLVGLKYTRFEATPEGRFYTPHAYIGLLVLALLVGRLLYRFVVLYYGTHGFAGAGMSAGVPNALASAHAYQNPYTYQNPYAYQSPYAYQRSPLTLGIFGALVGYYISYYLGVLSRSRVPAIPEQASGAE